jgi:CRISPR-associated exonuclease Cas4
LTLDDLPHPIKKMMLDEANNKDDYQSMPNCYHITELVGCIRKAYYRKTLPKKDLNLETAKNFHRGNTWDKDFCRCFKHNQVRVTHRCQKVPISISGHFDFLNEDNPTEPIITDLKSPKTLFYIEREGKPSEQYRKQVLFYCWCSAISKGAILYWDGHKALTYPVEATDEACHLLIDELETKSLMLYMALRTGKPPNKDAYIIEPWECQYCNYQEECNK